MRRIAGTGSGGTRPIREFKVGAATSPPIVAAGIRMCHAVVAGFYMSDSIMFFSFFSAGCIGVMASAPGKPDGM